MLTEEGGGVTLLRRCSDEKMGEESVLLAHPPLVKCSSHGVDRGNAHTALPLVERRSHGGQTREGPRRPTSLRTVGHCSMDSEARSSERDRSDGGELVKARGSKDRCVEWRARVPSSGGHGPDAPSDVGEAGGYEVVERSEVATLAPNLELDIGSPKVLIDGHVGMKGVETKDESSGGPIDAMARMGDNVGLAVGQQLGVSGPAVGLGA